MAYPYVTGSNGFEIPVTDVDRGSLLRRTGHVARALEGRRVLIFGQGAIGSAISMLLAKSGVETLHISDGGRLRPGNVVRHEARLSWVGERKTMAIALEIGGHAPYCEVIRDGETWDPERLTDWIEQADIVVDATATPAFSLLVNELCLASRSPAVYATSHCRAAIGRIRVVRPGRDACLVCHRFGHAESESYPFIPPGDEETFIEAGCGTPTIEASGVDVEATANWAARVVLWLLQEKLGEDNLCHVVNDTVPNAQEE
jgi:molybdopterin/thiamine biosynthesis adenylyltransferase